MMRIIIQHLLLFVLPTALYAGYLVWRRRQAQAAGNTVPAWEEGPWFWLVVAGAVLVIVSLAALALFGGAGPDAVYVPARIEDGRVVPGELSE